jgi:tetratricopeptide (TPR) repeat protein
MNAQFVAIVERMCGEQGKSILLDAAKCKPLLNDYAKNEYKRERHLLLLAIEAGVGREIAQARELGICRKIQARFLREERFIDEAAAKEVIDLLAGVLRGERASPAPSPTGRVSLAPEPPQSPPSRSRTQPAVQPKSGKSFFFITIFIAIIAFAVWWSIGTREDAESQYRRGMEYADRQDDAEAVKQLRMAAEQGHTSAQFNLDVMYSMGRGVARDDAEAVKWYRMAAEQGDASAQFNLGVAYDNGRGAARDDEEAVKWYRMAAAQGEANAQNNLGVAYANGQGILSASRCPLYFWLVSNHRDTEKTIKDS